MSRKPKDETKTTEFEVEGIEEAYAPAETARQPGGGKFRGLELPKLQVERPPELQTGPSQEPKLWIIERRARGLLAAIRRWFVGRSR